MTKTSIWKMPIILALVFLLTNTNNGYPGDEAEYHFRHTRWGMSQSEIRLAENGEPEPDFSKGQTLVWRGELLGEQAAVVYTFAFNKLVRAKYVLAKYRSALQGTFYRFVSPKKPSAENLSLILISSKRP